jgi:hypothetical protein
MKLSERWDTDWREILQETPLELRSWRVAHKDVDIDNVIEHRVILAHNHGEHKVWFTAMKSGTGWSCIMNIERMRSAKVDESLPENYVTADDEYGGPMQVIDAGTAAMIFPSLRNIPYVYGLQKVEA